jgi:hypothetical protein
MQETDAARAITPWFCVALVERFRDASSDGPEMKAARAKHASKHPATNNTDAKMGGFLLIVFPEPTNE